MGDTRRKVLPGALDWLTDSQFRRALTGAFHRWHPRGREKIVARSDEDRQDFLRKRGFSKAETGRIVETVLAGEGRPPENVFELVPGITAVARSKLQQDARLVIEGKAKALLEKVV